MTNTLRTPNLFLVGAPKSGTTALAAYLADHPNIYFSVPKELFYWNEDFPWLRDRLGIYTLNQYLKYFSNADLSRHRIIAEGSTTYLQSRTAIKLIFDFNPQAKFIVLLRNPIDTAYAMHGELLIKFNEDEPDFEKAWDLQDQRANGEMLPPRSRVPNQLQYRDVAAFGDQLSRMFAIVPEGQRLVILHDDFVADSSAVYGKVLEFLGLEHDGRTSFPRLNQSRQHRFGHLAMFYHQPPRLIQRPIRSFQKWLAGRPNLKRRLQSLAYSKRRRPPLRPEFRQKLTEYFADEIYRTSQLIDRDLSHWLAPQQTQPPRPHGAKS